LNPRPLRPEATASCRSRTDAPGRLGWQRPSSSDFRRGRPVRLSLTWSLSWQTASLGSGLPGWYCHLRWQRRRSWRRVSPRVAVASPRRPSGLARIWHADLLVRRFPSRVQGPSLPVVAAGRRGSSVPRGTSEWQPIALWFDQANVSERLSTMAVFTAPDHWRRSAPTLGGRLADHARVTREWGPVTGLAISGEEDQGQRQRHGKWWPPHTAVTAARVAGPGR
jgi:hypothetical protein